MQKSEASRNVAQEMAQNAAPVNPLFSSPFSLMPSVTDSGGVRVCGGHASKQAGGQAAKFSQQQIPDSHHRAGKGVRNYQYILQLQGAISSDQSRSAVTV